MQSEALKQASQAVHQVILWYNYIFVFSRGKGFCVFQRCVSLSDYSLSMLNRTTSAVAGLRSVVGAYAEVQSL